MIEYSEIEVSSFHSDNKGNLNPLFVGCSGGGGHNAGIVAIIKHLISKKRITNESIKTYEPVLYSEKPKDIQAKYLMDVGFAITNIPGVSVGIKKALKATPLPVLPSKDKIDEEIDKLNKSQLTEKGEKKKRQYVDVLLDGYPTGYENVAIWNILQKNDETAELKKLIELQSKSDLDNYKIIKKYFYDQLMAALKAGNPFSEIISTQAMSLAAICDAVIEYNEEIKSQKNIPPIVIHQYMTDLPTNGAIHFFNALAQLNEKQRSVMSLYGVNFSASLAARKGLFKPAFHGIYSINPKENPLVRPGFSNQKLATISFDKKVTLPIQNNDPSPKEITVLAKEKVASIMLGSQASNDTIEYVKKLAASNFDKIFVFGGKSPHLRKELEAFMNSRADLAKRIVLLDNQDDAHMAGIMVRSNLAIIRGGGLSVMEQMALPHLKGQTVLLHCKEDEEGQLTSGISWEDDNGDELIEYLQKAEVQAGRTSINKIAEQLAQVQRAQPITFDTKGALQGINNYYIRKLDHEKTVGAKKRIDLFFNLVDKIATGDPKKVEAQIKLMLGLKGPVVETELLRSLERELQRDGIHSLQQQLKKLELIKQTSGDISELELKTYSTSSEPFKNTEIEFTGRGEKEFLKKQLNTLLSKLRPYINEINMKEISMAYGTEETPKSIRQAFSFMQKSLTTFFKPDLKYYEERGAEAVKLKESFEKLLKEIDEKTSMKDVATSLAYHLLSAQEKLKSKQSDGLNPILSDGIQFLKKNYPTNWENATELYNSQNKLVVR